MDGGADFGSPAFDTVVGGVAVAAELVMSPLFESLSLVETRRFENVFFLLGLIRNFSSSDVVSEDALLWIK